MTREEVRESGKEKVLDYLRERPPGSRVPFGTFQHLLSGLCGPNGTNSLLIQMDREGLIECSYSGKEASVRLKAL